MLRNRFTQLSFLLLAAVTTVAIAAPPPGKGGGKNSPKLSVVVLPESFTERNAGAFGIVTRENSDTNVTVTITSSDADEATLAVPGSVQPPAGEISVQILTGEVSAVFDVFPVNDDVTDGDQSVTISVSATDHSEASTSITVVDDEALPPIAYVPTTIAMPSYVDTLRINDMNESGVVGGYFFLVDGAEQHAMICDPATDPPTIIDLQTDVTIAGFDYENWVVASIVGLNNNGLAVGYAESLPDFTERKGIVIDLTADPIQVYDVPASDQDWVFTYARKVNDNGDVLGVYTRPDAEGTEGFYLVNLGLRGIENAYPLETTEDKIVFASSSLTETEIGVPAKVVSELINAGGLHVYTQGGGADRYITDFGLEGPESNPSGDIAALARTEEIVPLKGKKTQTITSYELFREFGGVQEFIPLPDYVSVPSINASGTVLTNRNGSDLFYSIDYGVVDLQSLLAAPIPALIGGSSHLNNYEEYGFSEIANAYNDPETSEASLIILSPVPLP